MKKEKKRYVLAQYAGYVQRTYDSKEEYDKLIEIINKHNKKEKKKYLFGNVFYTIDSNNKYHVIVNAYNKLSSKATISELDSLTSEYDDEKKLLDAYKSKLLVKGDIKPMIAIVYLEDKNSKDKTEIHPDRGIKNIPVLYKEDLKYFNDDYLFKCIRFYLDTFDLGFFLELCCELNFNKDCLEDIEKIREYVSKSREDSNYLESLFVATQNLYNSYIVERNKDGSVIRDDEGREVISQRRKRDFVFFVKNYHISKRKKYFPVEKIDEPNHKLNDTFLSRSEREEDFMEEEAALDAWDKGLIYNRKNN